MKKYQIDNIFLQSKNGERKFRKCGSWSVTEESLSLVMETLSFSLFTGDGKPLGLDTTIV